MGAEIQAYLALPLVQAVLVGIWTAAGADLIAFRKWQSWDDAAVYNYNVASFRLFQGAVLGLLGGFGLAVVS